MQTYIISKCLFLKYKSTEIQVLCDEKLAVQGEFLLGQ